MRYFFSLCRESYGVTIKPLGKFESAPNHLDNDGNLEIIDEYELRRLQVSIEVVLNKLDA